jgi:two-component system phosphate regulon sensor histidine kinase PhoR
MKKKRIVTGIIALMSVSLILIIAMQAIFLVRAYDNSKEFVDRSVSEAISQTISSLKKQDALSFAYYKIQNNQSNDKRAPIPIDPNAITNAGSNFKHSQSINNDKQLNSYYEKLAFSFLKLPLNDGQIREFAKEMFTKEQNRFNELIKEIEREYHDQQIPIEDRFSSKTVSNILSNSLSAFGLYLDFEFAIIDDNHRIKIQSDNFDLNRLDKCYKYSMNPENILSNPNMFLIDFPNKNKYVLETIYTQLGVSVGLTLLFIITFGISLYAHIKQKNLGEIKNDFINNMTHEFKTPIATIKLAAASLKNAKTTENSQAMSNMIDIILQETSRMNHHIEQVLQMAVLDKQNLQVKKTKENINDILRDTVNNIELVVAEKGGKIKLVVIDDNIMLNVDRDLISNVFNNLLDNAIKYSKDAPNIKVTSFVEADKFHIAFKDNGIGMSREFQSKIFDKFYRAPTGNVHNIKGFGLGLNYAKEIINAHKGDIVVRSCAGKGSTFTVILPLK